MKGVVKYSGLPYPGHAVRENPDESHCLRIDGRDPFPHAAIRLIGTHENITSLTDGRGQSFVARLYIRAGAIS